MLKKETIELIEIEKANFNDILSICIGKMYLFQIRFKDYLGNYNSWNTDVNEGILKIDNRYFDVEYIGTTSNADNYWYSSELEKIIPDQNVNMMINTIEIMRKLEISNLTESKILLNNDVNGYNLSMIYCAFAPDDVACFCGSGDTSIYMFVKRLPEKIFYRMNSIEFSNRLMEIISIFNVNHKLMTKSLLIENDIKYTEDNNKIIADFGVDSKITIEFDNTERLLNISGNLSEDIGLDSLFDEEFEVEESVKENNKYLKMFEDKFGRFPTIPMGMSREKHLEAVKRCLEEEKDMLNEILNNEINNEKIKQIVENVIGDNNPFLNATAYEIVKKIVDLPNGTETTIANLLEDSEFADVSLQVEINRIVKAVCERININLQPVERENRFTGLPYHWSFKIVKTEKNKIY